MTSGHWRMGRYLIATLTIIFAITMFLMMPSVSVAKEKMADSTAAAIFETAANSPIDAADALSDGWHHEKAVEVLVAYADTTDPEVLWRLARSRIDYAERLLDEEAAVPHYEAAYNEADRAIEKAPELDQAHLMKAIAAGRIALHRGPFSASGFVKDAYRHAHLAVDYADSTPVAYFVLGRTHKALMEKSGIVRRLAGLSFAKYDSIEYYFKAALEEINDNMIAAHVEYADYLMHKANRPASARDHLQKALALPIRDQNDDTSKEEARELLKEIEE